MLGIIIVIALLVIIALVLVGIYNSLIQLRVVPTMPGPTLMCSSSAAMT